MKHLCIALFVFGLAGGAGAAIVDNSTTGATAEDSIVFSFFSLDSLGNPTTADSLYILVAGPNGVVAYRDSMAISSARIVSTTIRGTPFYHFKDQVSNLDGGGVAGVYAVSLVTKRDSDGLLTPTRAVFQIISRELSDQLQKIEDSVLVKGGAIDTNFTEQGGNDSTQVARWVWNTPHANHRTDGTFGKYLDAEVSGVSGGSGAYAYTIQVYDSTTDQVLVGANLTVRNVSQTALLAVGRSDENGRAGFNLDAASYVIAATAPGYLFDVYDTIIVTGAGVDTLYGDQFDPANPGSPTLCRVWGFLYSANGTAEENATVAAYLPGGTTTAGSGIIVPVPVSTQSDSTGYFFLDLVPSDSLGDGGVPYEFTISRRDGTVLHQRLTVPTLASWRLVW